MNLGWLESILYSFISGLTEFLPISSSAHQEIMLSFFGADGRDPVRDFLVHLAVMLSLYSVTKPFFEQIQREQKMRRYNRGGLSHPSRAILEYRFIKNASIPLLVGLLILTYLSGLIGNSLLVISVFLLINGVILFLPQRMMQGNKDVRSMTYLDSIIIGLSASLSAFSGISRVGCMTSVGAAQGADKKNALNWALLLSIPALAGLLFIDLFQIIAMFGSINLWNNILTYLLSVIFAYLGGYASVLLIRFISINIGFSVFMYYSWGASLLYFLLYLFVV